MDEESMALVEELRGFILQTVKVREETADTLAMALIAAYEISGRDGTSQSIPLANRRPTKSQVKPVRTAETEGEESEDDGIVKASDLTDYPPDEKERIIQERLIERGIKNAMIPSKVATRMPGGAQGAGRALNDRELAESPILEAKLLLRLQEQEAREAAGLSKVRRS
jgi:hypothetical protein